MYWAGRRLLVRLPMCLADSIQGSALAESGGPQGSLPQEALSSLEVPGVLGAGLGGSLPGRFLAGLWLDGMELYPASTSHCRVQDSGLLPILKY